MSESCTVSYEIWCFMCMMVS